MSDARERDLGLAQAIYEYVALVPEHSPPLRDVAETFSPTPTYTKGEVASALMELLHSGRLTMSDDRRLSVPR